MAEKRIKPAGAKRRRGGGRFVVSLLILLIAGGVVFYFGWVQYQLDEGEYAVVHTKTRGYEDTVLKSGEFSWRWEALFPTNLTLHTFSLQNRHVDISQSGTLPSGEFYAIIAGPDVEFNWKISASVGYRLKPEALPELVKNGVSDSALDSVYKEYEQRLTTEIIDAMIETGRATSEQDLIPDYGRLEAELKTRAAKVDERMEILTFTLQSLSFPDLALYAESRRLYLSLMAQREAVLAEVETSSAVREDIQGARLSLLERYGKVLSDYPVLLDLFALEDNPGGSLLPPVNLQ